MAPQPALTPASDLLWGPRHRPRRGPKPALSLDRIVAVGIDIADAEGLSALSMQAIADQVGFTKMSLYRYTPGKAELTALMFDTAMGPPPDLTDITGGWQAELRAWANHSWRVFSRHPWAIEASVGQRLIGPNELGWLNTGLASLSGLGLTGGERLDAIVLLIGHVRNLVQQNVDTGQATPERDLGAAMAAIITEHRDTYPHASEAFQSAASGSGQDDALAFGISRILDGLAALVEERARDLLRLPCRAKDSLM